MFYTRFNRRRGKWLSCDPDGDLTKQEFEKEADVNNVISQYMRTGVMPGSAFSTRNPQFGDFSGVRDLQSAEMILQQSHDAFMTLDPHVRERFRNSPAELEAFIRAADQNPELYAEGVKLGIFAERVQPSEPDQKPVVSE